MVCDEKAPCRSAFPSRALAALLRCVQVLERPAYGSSSADDFMDHRAIHVGQPVIAAGVIVGET